jgi:hypothetical protein
MRHQRSRWQTWSSGGLRTPGEGAGPRDGPTIDALPARPETVAAYLAHEAEKGSAASTITRRCAAIRYAHRSADLEPPTNSEHVRATLRGICRAVGAAPARKARCRRTMAIISPWPCQSSTARQGRM